MQLLPGCGQTCLRGLLDWVASQGIETRESALYSRFGQRIYAEPRGRFGDYPLPEIRIHRGRLHAILYQTLVERAGAEVISLNVALA